jgi:hypothetical protein
MRFRELFQIEGLKGPATPKHVLKWLDLLLDARLQSAVAKSSRGTLQARPHQAQRNAFLVARHVSANRKLNAGRTKSPHAKLFATVVCAASHLARDRDHFERRRQGLHLASRANLEGTMFAISYQDILSERAGNSHVVVSAWFVLLAIAVFLVASA